MHKLLHFTCPSKLAKYKAASITNMHQSRHTSREHRDYMLKANIPKALEPVEIKTIRNWEHRIIRWMELTGMEKVQRMLNKCGSQQYKSHRKVSESVAQRLIR